MNPKDLENEFLKSFGQPAEQQDASTDSSLDEQTFGQWLRLGQLILRMQDGDLEQRYIHRLEQWLMADPQALNYYIQFTWICTGLHLLYNPRKSWLSENVACEKTSL